MTGKQDWYYRPHTLAFDKRETGLTSTTVLERVGTKWALARRAGSFAVSPWAAVDGLFERHPDLIYFGNGAPAPELVPADRLRAAAAEVWARPGDLDLGYTDVAGYPPLRELIARRMAAVGVEVGADDVIVTNGSQQGIDLISRLLLDPGDAIVVEGPTYIGALQIFDAYEASYVVVPLDHDGLDVAALEAALTAAHPEGTRPPKLLYAIPTFQNPAGSTLPLDRRRALIDLARRHGLLVVEDDPYGELRFDGDALPPLRALDPDVVYLGTFSKTIAPGLRLGWMIVPPDLRTSLVNAREVADIHGEKMTQRIVHRAAEGFLDEHVAAARTVYRRRRDVLLDGLRRELPDGFRWDVPAGGFFVWVDLPDGIDAGAILFDAADLGVGYLPGDWFYPGGRRDRGRNGLRLSFANLAEERIDEGTRRLGRAMRAAVQSG
jgi:2-aminoadipate transaminase